MALTQTGAGRYEGHFEADAPGAYLVTAREGESALVGSAGVVRPRGDELRGEGTDHALLAQIAALTGGRVRTELGGVFRERPPPAYAYAPIWRPLVVVAMLALLIGVALRRLVLPFGERRARASAVSAGASRAREAATPTPAAPAQAPPARGDPDPGPPAPEAPRSLAETLLARKKKG
ncbi:MAG: hypothetical protein M5U28_18230 [Sandaracinaceae bacterium]|nr:hypothetical protein [Sandaracinaceae bacterium]